MELPNVGKPSFRYSFLYWTVSFYFRLYFRSFKVVGRENIPAGKPVMFAGNHQNALMDALSVLFAARGKVAFLARADMFKRKFIARLLFLFRILPVYRIRDGISSMGQNDASFRMAAEVLKAGTPIALFPEGNHAGFKRLRSLKKGICRIAFMAVESSGYTLDLFIVPTGIDYSNYADPGARLLVRYGKPVRIAEFVPLYRENPQKALSALRDKLSEALEPTIINISSEEYYDEYMDICQYYRPFQLERENLANTHYNRQIADQEIISKLDGVIESKPDEFEIFRIENNMYRKQLKQYGLRDWLLAKSRINAAGFLLDCLVSILLMPLYFYGLLLNYLPYKLPPQFTKKVKDHVFLGSLHFGIGLVLFPVYFLLAWILFSIFVKSLVLRLLFAVSLPLSGIFTFYFYIHLLKLRGRFRLLKLRYTRQAAFGTLVNSRIKLIHSIEEILKTT